MTVKSLTKALEIVKEEIQVATTYEEAQEAYDIQVLLHDHLVRANYAALLVAKGVW